MYDDDTGDNLNHPTAVVIAFTDHLAIILRIDLQIPVLSRGRSEWKLNTRLLRETEAAMNVSSRLGNVKGQ
jgi:hypothetical protein